MVDECTVPLVCMYCILLQDKPAELQTTTEKQIKNIAIFLKVYYYIECPCVVCF